MHYRRAGGDPLPVLQKEPAEASERAALTRDPLGFGARMLEGFRAAPWNLHRPTNRCAGVRCGVVIENMGVSYMTKTISLLSAALVACLSSAAVAHDFFLIPDQFLAAKAGPQPIQASVGSSFPQPLTVVTADRIDRIFADGAGKPRLTIVGPGAKALNLRLTGATAGTVVAAIKTRDRDVEYAEDRIPLILEEYRVGPQAVAAVESMARPRTLKVSSRRFAKTMLCIRQCGNRAAAMRPMGVDLEFVATGASVDHFRLLSHGRPLANYPVDLITADGKRGHLTTDGKGEVHLAPAARGSMMLFAAVMTPPAGGERFILNLSTLTFGRP